MSGTGKRLLLLGAPGCGKGTQAEILAKKLGIPAISTGEMLREAVAAGSDLGRRVEQIMASGALVNDDTMADVVRSRLAQEDAQGGYLLDGYPRTPGQAETLAALLAERDQGLDAVVVIEVPEEELIRRALARQRDDDKEEVIRHRQEVYRQQTAPLIDYYTEKGIVLTIDGFQSIEGVNESILKALESVG